MAYGLAHILLLYLYQLAPVTEAMSPTAAAALGLYAYYDGADGWVAPEWPTYFLFPSTVVFVVTVRPGAPNGNYGRSGTLMARPLATPKRWGAVCTAALAPAIEQHRGRAGAARPNAAEPAEQAVGVRTPRSRVACLHRVLTVPWQLPGRS